jgi:hypothetical protein
MVGMTVPRPMNHLMNRPLSCCRWWRSELHGDDEHLRAVHGLEIDGQQRAGGSTWQHDGVAANGPGTSSLGSLLGHKEPLLVVS